MKGELSMQFKPENAEEVVNWFRTKCADILNCSFCLTSEPGALCIASNFFSLPVFNKLGEIPNAACIPLILLCCNNCGNCRMLSATILEEKGCPHINLLPPKPKKNVLNFLDYFKGKK